MEDIGWWIEFRRGLGPCELVVMFGELW